MKFTKYLIVPALALSLMVAGAAKADDGRGDRGDGGRGDRDGRSFFHRNFRDDDGMFSGHRFNRFNRFPMYPYSSIYPYSYGYGYNGHFGNDNWGNWEDEDDD